MVEWSKAPHWKCGVPKGTEGSNPSLSAIFFCPFLIYLKKSPLLLFCKTRWLKGFYNISASVQETHSDSEIRPFSPDFVWNLSEFWVFLKGVKIKVLFVSAWLLTRSCFYTLPSKGKHTKTERVFISPHFCLGNLPSKFLPCKLTLWGEEVKTLTIFSSLTKILWSFFSQNRFTRFFRCFLPLPRTLP